MTADDIRAAIAGIVAGQKANRQAKLDVPNNLPKAERYRRYDSLLAQYVILASQREHLEGLLKERIDSPAND